MALVAAKAQTSKSFGIRHQWQNPDFLLKVTACGGVGEQGARASWSLLADFSAARRRQNLPIYSNMKRQSRRFNMSKIGGGFTEGSRSKSADYLNLAKWSGEPPPPTGDNDVQFRYITYNAFEIVVGENLVFLTRKNTMCEATFKNFIIDIPHRVGGVKCGFKLLTFQFAFGYFVFLSFLARQRRK